VNLPGLVHLSQKEGISLPHSFDLLSWHQGAAAGGTNVTLTFVFASVPADSDEQGQEEVIETEAEESLQDKCLLHKEEEKKEGALDFQVYKAYWLAMGSCLALSILFSLLLMQGEATNQEHISL